MPAVGGLDPAWGGYPEPRRRGGAGTATPGRSRTLPPWGWPLAAVVAVTVVISRRPDAVTHAQFYAEDGTVWFAAAYERGFASLLIPYNGYLQTLSRLVAIIFTPLGLRWAPLAFNLIGIAVQVAPALFLLSSRLEDAAPLSGRASLAAAYLLIPSFELDVTLTNAQWHLAVLATLIVVARAPRGWLERLFDVSAVLICALTGPFGFLLLVVLGIRWLRGRERWWMVLGSLCLICDVIQGVAIIASGRPATGSLGATPARLLELIADKVILDGLFAQDFKPVVYLQPGPGTAVAAGLIDLAAGAVVLAALVRGPAALRLFILTAGSIALAGVASPLVSASEQWARLLVPSVGQRYFFLAECAWLACLLWAVTRLHPIPLKGLGVLLVGAAMAVGLAAAWQYPPFYNDHPETYADEFNAAKPGTTFVAPINPPGWTIRLTVR